MKRSLLAGLVIALALTVVGVVLFQRQPPHPITSQSNPNQPRKELPPVAAEVVQTEATISAPGNTASVQAVKTNAPAKTALSVGAAPPTNRPKEILDPDARVALSFVGSDPEAEQYWFDAINDPDLPASERKDLIEDLNEDGLSDPDHPGMQDLQLIMNRLRILQLLAYDPMDKVNYDAIQEAYKDLDQMYHDLTGN